MKKADVFKSKFFRAEDVVDGELTLTIKSVEQELIGQPGGEELRAVMGFVEDSKGLVLNRTNWNVLERLYGRDSDGWVGKKITLYAAEVDFRGERVLGLRVRAPRSTAA